jgi:hypothetical protein
MLGPEEWAIVEEVRQAGAEFERVLEHHRARLGGSWTPLASDASVLELQYAHRTLTYELLTGAAHVRPRIVEHHRVELYGPPCTRCRKPLRTPAARLCVACGERRATSDVNAPKSCSRSPRLHLSSPTVLTVEEALEEDLPFDAFSPFLRAIAISSTRSAPASHASRRRWTLSPHSRQAATRVTCESHPRSSWRACRWSPASWPA